MRVLRVWMSLSAAILSSAPVGAQSPPATPTGLTAAAVSGTRVQLSWQDNSSNETEFVLLRRLGTGLYARIAVVGANTTSYADTTVSPTATYTYITRAINGAGVSAWSNEPSVTTPNGPPPAPGNLTATPTSAHQIDLRWRDRSYNETGFALLRRIDAALYRRIAVLDPDTTGYSDTTASPGTAYTYIIRALGDDSQLLWSNEAGATIPAGPPTAPAGLTAIPISGRVDLTWKDTSNNETGFVLLRKTGDGLYSRIAVLGPNTTGYSDTTVIPDTHYTYITRAINAAGASAWSNEAPALDPPEPPSSLIAGALSDTEISLAWVDESDNEAGFDIWRRSNEGYWVQAGTAAADVTTFLDSGLVPNAIYLYRVRARHAGSVSAWSNEAVGSPVTLPWIVHSAGATASGDSTVVTLEFALPADYTFSGTWIRVLDSQGRLTGFHAATLTQGAPEGSGYYALNTGNYPPGTYQVRAEMRFTRPDGLMSAVVSPWSSLEVP